MSTVTEILLRGIRNTQQELVDAGYLGNIDSIKLNDILKEELAQECDENATTLHALTPSSGPELYEIEIRFRGTATQRQDSLDYLVSQLNKTALGRRLLKREVDALITLLGD